MSKSKLAYVLILLILPTTFYAAFNYLIVKTSSPTTSSPFMWGINIFHPFRDAHHKVGEYNSTAPKIVKDNHVGWVRFNIKWKDLMPADRWGQVPSPNSCLWLPYDEMVQKFHDEGVGMIAIISCGQIDMIPQREDATNCMNPSVVGAENYISNAVALTEAVVTRYKDKIKFWQIENEVNAWPGHAMLMGFRARFEWYWLVPDWRNFRERLLSELYYAVKKADPSAQVIACISYVAWHPTLGLSPTWHVPRLYDCLGVTVYSHYLDSVSSPEIVARNYVRQAYEFSILCGEPVIILEAGYPSANIGYWSEDGQRRFVETISEEVMFYSHNIKGLFIYRYRDSNPPGTSLSRMSFPQEDYFGLVRYDGAAKSAWKAYGNKILYHYCKLDLKPPFKIGEEALALTTLWTKLMGRPKEVGSYGKVLDMR